MGANTEEEHDEILKKFYQAAKRHNLEFNDRNVIGTDTLDLLGHRIKDGIISPDPSRVKALMDLPIPHNSAALKRCIGMFLFYAKWIYKYSESIKPL